jgi:succinate dehydrogenase flavin-adding protein (antitoxin of CptAB toxin-antitoxin module)
MKSKFVLCSAIAIFSLFSCTQEMTDKEKNVDAGIVSIYNADLNVSIEKKSNTLVFNNAEDFQNVVSKLKSSSFVNKAETKSSNVDQNEYSEIINSSDITLQKNGFHSLYDDFINAMNEAESYYERAGGYEEFKQKYAMLYFPEEGDDYSAYLPVSDKNIAKLLNSNGEVMIDGEIVNLKDINSYEQLIDLKLAPPSENAINLTTRANTDYPLNELSLVKCNDRKLWVNVILRPGSSPGIYEEILVEVCFRKKGALGLWYNYSSDTFLAWEPGVSYHKSGYSSHDYLWARVFKNGAPVPFQGLMYVKFRGFGDECGDTKYYFRVNK